MRKLIAREYYLKWCGVLDNDYERTAIYDEGLLFADKIFSLETDTHRIVKKCEPPLLSDEELHNIWKRVFTDKKGDWGIQGAAEQIAQLQRSSILEYYKG